MDLLKQELTLISEYIQRVDQPRIDFLLTHCELLLSYARACDQEECVAVQFKAA